jgi:hypothetical protein
LLVHEYENEVAKSEKKMHDVEMKSSNLQKELALKNSEKEKLEQEAD